MTTGKMTNNNKKRIAEAIKCYNSNDVEKAERICEEVLTNDPNNLEALNLVAGINLNRGNYDIAIEKLSSSLKIAPKSLILLRNMITCLKRLGKHQEAHQYITLVCEITNNSDESIVELANNLILTNKKEEALQLLERFHSKNLNSEILDLCKANCLYELKNYSESKTLYESLYSTNKENFQILFRLGYFNLEEKNYSKAIEYFNRILENKKKLTDPPNDYNHPKNTGLTLYNLGFSHEKLGDDINAEKNYLLALDFEKNHVDTHVNLSNIFLRNHNTDKSLYHLNTALKLAPKQRELYINLSDIYAEIGDHNKSTFYKRIGAGALVFKSKKEYGYYEINKEAL